MVKSLVILFCLVAVFWAAPTVATDDCQVEQIHLTPAVASDPNFSAINVAWVTQSSCDQSDARMKLASDEGTNYPFIRPGSSNRVDYPVSDNTLEGITKYYHNATIDHLDPSTLYSYKILSNGVESDDILFKTPRESVASYPVSFVTLGDIGVCGDANDTATALMDEIDTHDMLLLLGDYAYDLDMENGKTGDDFFKEYENVFSRLTSLTTPGNHDKAFDFFHYRNRFFMPNYSQSQNMWFSYQVGGVKFIYFNTEFYFYDGYDEPRAEQFTWLKQEFQQAAADENVDWILAISHRPMYCSSPEGTCERDPAKIKELEPLFKQYNVDIYITGHLHYYERLYPIYDGVAEKSETPDVYVDPKSTAYVISGIAGNQEVYTSPYAPGPNSVMTSGTIGYSRFTVESANKLTFEQVNSVTREVIDTFTIVKNEANNGNPDFLGMFEF